MLVLAAIYIVVMRFKSAMRWLPFTAFSYNM